MSEKEAKILVVDDTPESLEVIVGLLAPDGYDIAIASNGGQALDLAVKFEPDLILLDVNMPEMNGFDVCRQLKAGEKTREMPVIFLTARVEPDDIVAGFRSGGADYITKPFNEEELKARVDTHLRLRLLVRELVEKNQVLENEIAQRKALTWERDELKERVSYLTQEEARRWGIEGFVGKSIMVADILDDIRRLQRADTVSVLITGESGTGKELVARAIHFGSDRRDGPFVPVNCSAVPHELADSLFLGHVKGAFTGADGDKKGYFELASGGTLFLDELGDMPLDLQAKLLRVLESREVMPVGSGEERSVDVRVLSATHVDLENAVQEGRFRQDLYYRLAGYPVKVAPLREHKEDIPGLVEHFLEAISNEMRLGDVSLSSEALAQLTGHSFPGNVRELRNIIERALVSSGGHIAPQHLVLDTNVPAGSQTESASKSIDTLPDNLAEAESSIIKRVLVKTEGNLSEAARILGIGRVTLYRKLAKMDALPEDA